MPAIRVIFSHVLKLLVLQNTFKIKTDSSLISMLDELKIKINVQTNRSVKTDKRKTKQNKPKKKKKKRTLL